VTSVGENHLKKGGSSTNLKKFLEARRKGEKLRVLGGYKGYLEAHALLLGGTPKWPESLLGDERKVGLARVPGKAKRVSKTTRRREKRIKKKEAREKKSMIRGRREGKTRVKRQKNLCVRERYR